MDVLKEKDVPLLNRKRVTATVQFDGSATPSLPMLKDLIAATFRVDKGVVAIRHVYPSFGRSTAKVIAHIYKTRDALLRLERLKKTERKEQEAAKKPEEKKAATEA